MKTDEKGHIVVETLVSFMLLVFFMTSILSLINVVVVQARVQYALNQTAQAVSMYEYCVHLTGLDDDVIKTAGKARKTRVEIDTFKENINEVFDGIEGLTGSTSVSGAYQSAQGSYQAGQGAYNQAKAWGETFVNDPKEMLSKVLTLGIDTGARYMFSQVAEPIVMRYLGNGSMSGEEYLESMQVFNFEIDPSASTMLDDTGSVVICATYEIDYKFGILPLPMESLKFTQRVATHAWLGGAGDGYKP